jgi:two-component system CheB/CheR fusion protein
VSLRAHNLIEAMPFGAWSADSSGQLLDANPAALRLFGVTLDEFRAKSVGELALDHDRASMLRAIGQLHLGAQLATEVRCTRPDGSTFWVELHAQRQADGCTFFYGTDVTARKHAETALRDSEERFRVFSEHSPAAVFIKDAEGRYLFVNRATCEQTGLGYTEMLGRKDTDLWPPAMAAELRRHDVEALGQDGPVRVEESVRDARGRVSHWRSVKFQVRTRGQRPLLGGIGLEVTESKRLIEDLRAREQALRLAAATGQVKLWRRNLVDGEVVTSDDSLELRWLTGQSGGTPDDVDWLARIHPDDRDAAVHSRDRMASAPATTSFEYRVNGDGNAPPRWRRVQVEVDESPDTGARCLTGVLHDITEHKRYEQAFDRRRTVLTQLVQERTDALTANERQLQSVLDGIPGMVATYDLDMRVRYANRAYARQFGYEPLGIKGVHVRDILGDALYQKLLPHIEAAWRGELRSYERELADPRAPDRPRYYQVQLIPDMVGPDMRGVLAVMFDVTELKRTQLAAEAANRSKSEFLANMSHEIRTPLNSVLGFAQLGLQQVDVDQPLLKEFFSRISDSGRLLLGVVSDILDFAKLDAGQLRLEQLPVSPRDIVGETVRLFEEAAQRKSIALRAQCASNLPHRCLSDPLRMSQILVNLVSNAVKFTEHGGVEVDARRDGHQVVFSVKDTGIGIDAETAERLYMPFEQADPSVTRRYGGSGLGLAITARLVAMMGGTIHVQSERGAGSQFVVRLPCVDSAA